MDLAATYNRSFIDATQWAKPAYTKYNPDSFFSPTYENVPRQPFANSVEGFQLLPSAIRPMDLCAPPGAQFKSYATGWEQRSSVLCKSGGWPRPFAPVVDRVGFFDNTLFPVVAHFGVVPQESVIVPRKSAAYSRGAEGRDSADQLRWLLDQGTPAYVEFNYPNAGEWGPIAAASSGYNVQFTVLTDLEGRILANLNASVTEAGLEPSDPLLFIAVGSLLVGLVTKGGRLIVMAFLRRAAQKEANTLVGASLAKQIAAKGKRIVVNIGGTGEVADAINLNPNIVAPRVGIPNLIAHQGENIGEIFEANSVDEIVSNSLPPNTLAWEKVLPGAQKVMKAGAKITIRFTGIGDDSKSILAILKRLNFRDIEDFMNKGVAITARK